MSNLSIDEIVEKAFALAYFIQGNRMKALSVVLEALGKLEVAAAAQVKRLYYTPLRRSLWPQAEARNHRTKVSLSDLHLLQRLIYVESEPYEKEREQMIDALSEEELLIHFIKYLIRISIRRNSFYVTLGISRLLHNYSTAETMEIYNIVVQDPERVKDDYYYRSRKARMIQEIKARFGGLVQIHRGPRGEERFQTREAAEQFVELVAESLDHFSPWHTPCSIPVGFNPIRDEIPALSSAPQTEEDKVEINRIHSVVHPDCYLRITDALKLEPPARRLSIPQFFLPEGKNNMNGPDKTRFRRATPLDADEIEMLKRGLSEKSARRKATRASLLSVVADGVERARLDLQRSGSIRFEIDEGAELVEVRALERDEAVLLAAYLVSADSLNGNSKSDRSEIVLEGGQKIAFELSSEPSEAGGGAPTFMTISYEETAWARAASLSLRRALHGLSEAYTIKGWGETAFARPALAGLLLMLCLSALVLFALRAGRVRAPVAEVTMNEQPTPLKQANDADASEIVNTAIQNSGGPLRSSNSNQNVTMRASSNRQRGKRLIGKTENRGDSSKPSVSTSDPSQNLRANRIEEQARVPNSVNAQAGNPALDDRDAAERDVTRSVDSVMAATQLSKVRKIFLDISGDAVLSEQATRMLTRSLQESQRLSSTGSKDEADAALKLVVSDGSNDGLSGAAGTKTVKTPETRVLTVFARLVNEDGEVIWPTKSKNHGRRYNGTMPEVTQRIARDLLKEIERSGSKR